MGFMMKAAGRMARGGSSHSKRQRREREEREARERAERRATCAKVENFELPMCVQMRTVDQARAQAYAKQMAFIEHCQQEPFAFQCIGTSAESAGIITIIVAILLFFCCCRGGDHRRRDHHD